MPVNPNDRPLATVREETIDALVANYGKGVLSLEAFERRLDDALAAETGDALSALTADLPVTANVDEMRKEQDKLGWRGTPDMPSGRTQRFVHIFGGGKRKGSWTVSPEVQVVCVFGGSELDFSAANFSAPVTRLRVWCVFGGAQFTVNENTRVINEMVNIFGGVDEHSASTARPDAPTIVLEGVVLFGGVHIRMRRALRERWLEFANRVKSALHA